MRSTNFRVTEAGLPRSIRAKRGHHSLCVLDMSCRALLGCGLALVPFFLCYHTVLLFGIAVFTLRYI